MGPAAGAGQLRRRVRGRALGQNANMEGVNALPYLVVAGALNAAGKRSTYSTAGASISVTAPAGSTG